MRPIRKAAYAAPAAVAALTHRLTALQARAAGMGWSDGSTEVSGPVPVGRLIDLLRGYGVALAPTAALESLRSAAPAALDAHAAAAATRAANALLDAMEHVPVPTAEWPAMRRLFGDETLGEWLGIAPASLRRYGTATRDTPQPVAVRLHWLAVVVSDLLGAYNAFGIRRWFDRPRNQLDGARPRDALLGDWSVDAPAVVRVRALAATVSAIPFGGEEPAVDAPFVTAETPGDTSVTPRGTERADRVRTAA